MMHPTQKTLGKFSRKFLPDTVKYHEAQGCDVWRDASCSFQPYTKPSLQINIECGAYRCMVCGTHGGEVFAFYMHKHGLGFIEACKKLNGMNTLQKLMAAYEDRDFSILTLLELFQLVEQRNLRPETAVRLAMEVGHVS